MRSFFIITVWTGLLLSGCSNSPFPRQNASYRVRYMGFTAPPKTLDPAVGYTAGISHDLRAGVYECLLEYHHLKRPYELIPGLAEAVPGPVEHTDGSVSYRFTIRAGVRFHDDPCFLLSGGPGATSRELKATDFEFELKRTADPDVLCPVISPFENIRGLRAFKERLQELRQADPAFAALPVNDQYARAGEISGVRVHGPYDLELILAQPYPQMLYWLAMPFAAAVPWEAVVYYDGRDGRPPFRDHAVGTGPYRLTVYDKEYRIVMERNARWYGLEHPEWRAPATLYPTEGEPLDAERGLLSPDYTGRTLGFIERFEFRREKESISLFGKFMQGYYDEAGISKERFETIVVENDLSPEMKALGIRLVKSVTPSISYIGFNMDDPVLGHSAGDAGRKLRQAMSMVIDAEEYTQIFSNGRGIPAQSPIPPGIFGYDPEYRNPYRTPNPERARELLVEAGYPNGVDPETGVPLRLTFDVQGTSSGSLLAYQFYVQAWRSLGLDVRLDATNYNQFEEKVRNGAYQIFRWGWIADYPDPENFLFLLSSEMARSKNNGPNSANFQLPAFDQRFAEMRRRQNDDRRYELCRELVKILEEECPWIPLTHSEDYGLYHAWFKNIKPGGLMSPTLKYQDVDPGPRDAYQEEHNQPITWPLYLALALFVAATIPAVVTFYRERQ